jgi:MFS family permease
MGYGGGAMIGSPLAVWLMGKFATGAAPGVGGALAVLGVVYLLAMTLGALGFRLPPTSLAPAARATGRLIAGRDVGVSRAWRTPQFWLLWGVLFANVTAGIAVIAMASPMFQDVFGARLLGLAAGARLESGQKAQIAAAAAGLVGLISLFNSLGRLFWASLSDRLGRKATYVVIFVLGMALYGLLPTLAHAGLAVAFVAAVCVIVTMYGGGFACLPAYVADLFGTRFVGAIHGRVITAWSAAGIVGPALIAALRQGQLDRGVPKAQIYDGALYLMVGLLFAGLIFTLLVRPVREEAYLPASPMDAPPPAGAPAAPSGLGVAGVLAWTAVGAPFAVGLFIALQKAAALF